ncbi:hypothetical protein AAFF_G00317310 [Aldrovandia affinis]|uniref:Uncharacterized protein n=1 Tax=Aldrovandia affinis TaxID=143900 RepID=A0AAD7R748_9TELE|nr:hypothetical protein AAFF_G00317310 [Aldrovandia affinis]
MTIFPSLDIPNPNELLQGPACAQLQWHIQTSPTGPGAPAGVPLSHQIHRVGTSDNVRRSDICGRRVTVEGFRRDTLDPRATQSPASRCRREATEGMFINHRGLSRSVPRGLAGDTDLALGRGVLPFGPSA